jgi:hypothetical protein
MSRVRTAQLQFSSRVEERPEPGAFAIRPVVERLKLYDLILSNIQRLTSLFICRLLVEADHVSSGPVVEFLRCNESK